jgi:Cu-processing system permease protein
VSALFEPGFGREVFKTVTLFVPRISALADVAARLASSAKMDVHAVVSLLSGFAVFTLATLAFGVWRFEQKDF